MVINLQFTTLNTPVPDFIFESLKDFSKNANSYHPQPNELIKKLTQKHNVADDMIFLTSGADEAIEMFAIGYGQKTYVFTPTYVFYKDIQEMHAHVVLIPSLQNNEYSISTEQRPDATLFFLANPNNPFGSTPREKIIELIENNPQAIIVVDEVYGEFVKSSAIDLLPKYKNLAVLRSFSKAYGLAGNRIGYILSNPDVINKIKWKTQWSNISYLSVGTAIAVLEHEEYYQAIRNDINQRRETFSQFLQSKGFTTLPSSINSVSIKLNNEMEGQKLNEYLKVNDIIVTNGDAESLIGLDKSFIRIAIGTKDEMEKVADIISQFK